ncbi:hypothetical protein Tco_0772515 [Tanacetum coccineum]|uniref:Uncharacterized protein n=1 Tax=Tanacetum coccineum TaxID=301880 RepID=A0ABQ4ZI41_9ASTR
MSGQLVELNNTVKIKQTTISKLKKCLRKKESKNEHLKSKFVDFTTVQNLRVKVEEFKSVNESLNLSVKQLSKALALAEATLRERDKMISAQCKKIGLLEEQSKTFHEKMIEMIEKEYESNVSKIFITSSTFETKNLELVKEMGDNVKCFDEEKKMFETTISKLKKVLVQRVKDFDDVKIELSRRIDKFETYFANLEKQNALLKSQLASQKYASLQKDNNDLRTSYNMLKEKYETSCKKT